MVSHPLRARRALGSVPSASMLRPQPGLSCVSIHLAPHPFPLGHLIPDGPPATISIIAVIIIAHLPAPARLPAYDDGDDADDAGSDDDADDDADDDDR